MDTTGSEPLAELIRRKNALLEIGERLRELAISGRDPTTGQVLDDFLSRFRRTRFLVLVVGDFNSGKSSLVNALLGRRLCPVKATPRTAKVTRVTSTPDPAGGEEVEISYLQDRPAERIQLGETTLEDLVAVRGASTDAVQFVDVYINPGTTILRLPLRLVDTPGLGSIEKEHTAITREYVQHADVVVFVFSASKPLTDAERAFLLLNRPLIDRVLFVVNQIDRVEGEEEDVLEYVRDGLKREVLATDAAMPTILPVSSRRFLESKEGEATSGVPELVAAIENHLAERPFADLLRTISEQQTQVCAALQDQTSMALGSIDTASKSVDAVLPALENLRRNLRQLSKQQAGIRRAAAERVGELEIQVPVLSSHVRLAATERIKQWVEACPSEEECKKDLPAFFALYLTNAVEHLDREFSGATREISDGALADLGRGFNKMEEATREVLAPAMTVSATSIGGVGRGVAALSGLSAFAEHMGGPQGGYGAATAALSAALGPSQEVRLLSIGAAVSLIVAALGGPVSWLFAGVASAVATFFGWKHSSSWRERVIDGVTKKLDAEVLPSVSTALQESLATFGATLAGEITDRSAAVLRRLLAVIDDAATELQRVGSARETERLRLHAQRQQLETIMAELAHLASETPTPPRADTT